MLIREYMPLRLHASVATPISGTFRWGIDEHAAENVPTNVSFSSAMPGGFEQCSIALPRKTQLDYPDLGELSTLTIYGATGDVAWQGRIETTPRTSGDHLAVTPGAVGWQAHLTDNQSAREIYIDIDQTHWQSASVQRRLNLLALGIDCDDPTVISDSTSGQPAVATQFTAPWSREHLSEAWYDAKGLLLGGVACAWKKNAAILTSDSNWIWQVGLSTDDLETVSDASVNLRAEGPSTYTVAPTSADRRWAFVRLVYTAAQPGAAGVISAIYWTYFAVGGLGTPSMQGIAGATGGLGVHAADVVAHAVGKYAPKLAFTFGDEGTIRPSNFSIPHLVFLDPTTAAQIIKDATRFELFDWAVWEGPTFWYNARGERGKKWLARIGPSGLQETGSQVDRMWNSVLVSYRDVGGLTRTVGPVGSGADQEDTSLADPDPTNPVTVAGLTRRAMLQMSTSTPAAAIKVGQAFLQQQRVLNTSGQATLTGHVEDDHGVTWPAWKVRAGDQISFVDAHDSSYRRIVKTDYNDGVKANTIQLDSPPEGLQALLERMSVSLMPLGLS